MKNSSVIKQVLKRLSGYRLLLACSLILAVLSVTLTLYAPILVGDAIDFMIGEGKVEFTPLFTLLIRIAVIVAATAVFQWLMGLCNNRITYCVARDVRNEAFTRLNELPLSYIDSHSQGDIVSRLITDVDQFSDGLLMGFTQLFTGVVTILGTLLFMLSVNVWITLVVVLITPLSLLAAALIARFTYRMSCLQSQTRGELTGLMNEMVENQKVVRAFGYEEEAVSRFDEISERLRKYSFRAVFYSSLTNPVTRFVNEVVYAGVGAVGALFVIRGALSVGQLSCFLSYAKQYTKPFNDISGVVTELQSALACASRVFQFIDEEPMKPDLIGGPHIDRARGSVELSHVDFSYVADRALLRDIDVSVKPGMHVAVVGPTGCGKTTLINLLMRFYDVDSGSISVDGYDVRKLTRENLREQYGMVLQDTWLKSGTIRENIAYGKPDATDEEIIRAAKAAHIHSYIMRLPAGYDTVLSEDGGSLSEGQRQLMCIARIMLELPPMLILDEATSSIDTRTELEVQNALSKMMEGRTSFVVAHRLSTVQEADLILVMRDGRIIERGTHESLLAADGFYAQLYRSQWMPEDS